MPFFQRIKLFGNDYILVGDLTNGGPIATEEQYSNFECPFAHLNPNGNIMRFRKIIGTKNDIQLSNLAVDVEEKAGMGNILSAILNPSGWADE